MKLFVYNYSDFVYARCTTEENEITTITPFNSNGVEKNMAYLYVRGGYTCIDSDFIPIGLYSNSTTEMTYRTYPLPNTATYAVGQANGVTEWVCFERKAPYTKEFSFSVKSFTNTYFLPAGSGFICVEGSVDANGISVVRDSYFKAKTEDTTLVGPGKIIVVT